MDKGSVNLLPVLVHQTGVENSQGAKNAFEALQFLLPVASLESVHNVVTQETGMVFPQLCSVRLLSLGRQLFFPFRFISAAKLPPCQVTVLLASSQFHL